ncbi:MAG TPA: macro domain-containing protein, partial [Verrucomicrobiae bacterium]
LAVQHSVLSIAFPSISTGAYGFPMKRAADIALRTTLDFFRAHDVPGRVHFVCFSPAASEVYSCLLRGISGR